MRWDYDPKWRDMFDDGVHRDILIVPHATQVTPVSGSAPIITSRVPKFYANDDPIASHHLDNDLTKEGKRIPNEYEPVEWTITNEDIIKEKFEYADGLCSNEKLTFGSCESAMVKFTIRNNKTYNDETGLWELDIPDLQTLQVISEDGKTLLGEVQGAAVIEVWQYINGDSDSLMWLGMFKVETDKASNNGYEREIIAYDFMLTFRDMDIFNWYKALFDGTPVDSDDPSKGYVAGKPKADEWTIGEALKNLFDNFAYMSPGRPTVTNPKDYLMDMDADKYPGYGMPIIIDPDLWNKNIKSYEIPSSEMQEGNMYERYGWMDILDLPFRKDEKIIKKGALSCGKFLEDIAALAGRFGFIRKDRYYGQLSGEDISYHDYDSTEKKHYNTYEKCILSFRPLAKSEGVTKETVYSSQYFDDSEVEKGIQWEHYDVREVKIIQLYDYDGNRFFYFCPKGLKKSTKAQWEAGNREELNIVNITENMFVAYLKKGAEGNDFILRLLEKGYSGNKTTIDYEASAAAGTKVTKTITYTGSPLLTQCFNQSTNRPYRPYQLSTYGDLCRMPGDIIMVEGTDKITGEKYSFVSFILVRRITGIQKMMDKYTAKGDTYASTFSDYRSGELNDSFHPQSLGYGRVSGGSSNNASAVTTVNGITVNDFIEMMRNCGVRFLDEPTECEAVYNAGNCTVTLKWKDPEDLTDYKPIPCAWEGTVVIRKEGSVPLCRWSEDSVKIVKSTTRDEYYQNGYVDDTIEVGKTYIYCFMPYYTTLDDEDHPVRNYRFTKTIEVDTSVMMTAPEITNATVQDGVNAEIDFTIPTPASGTISTQKLVGKKGSSPDDISDGDVIITIASGATSALVTGLDEMSEYFFKVFIVDSNDNTAESDSKLVNTTADEGWNYDYTGSIQTFTAPKTGIYQLETWGAQGGDASDGTLTARGGYGAYAVGEVFLTQGDTLYINVGGQNGYGGGGVPPVVPPEYQAQIDQINGDSGSGLDFFWKSYTTWNGSHLINAPLDDYSWSKKADASGSLVNPAFDTRYMYPNTKFDVLINGSDNSYELKLRNYEGREDGINFSGAYVYKCYANTTQMVGASPSSSYAYDFFLNNSVLTTGTLSDCLDYIIANFRNVNIYVNGVQWASV